MKYLLTENDIEFLVDGIAVDDFAHDLARAVELVVTEKLTQTTQPSKTEQVERIALELLESIPGFMQPSRLETEAAALLRSQAAEIDRLKNLLTVTIDGNVELFATTESLGAQLREMTEQAQPSQAGELSAMAVALRDFLKQAAYLSHPQVPEFEGTANGDSVDAWELRLYRAAIIAAINAKCPDTSQKEEI